MPSSDTEAERAARRDVWAAARKAIEYEAVALVDLRSVTEPESWTVSIAVSLKRIADALTGGDPATAEGKRLVLKHGAAITLPEARK